MKDEIKLTEQITVGAQPSRGDLEKLSERGFETLINLRTDGEEDQPISPEQEGQIATQAGLRYIHFPVSVESMSEERVEDFRSRLEAVSKPVYVHCRTGKRSGALVMMHSAVQQGLSGDEAFQKALDMGFECDVPELERFFKQYIDSHVTA